MPVLYWFTWFSPTETNRMELYPYTNETGNYIPFFMTGSPNPPWLKESTLGFPFRAF